MRNFRSYQQSLLCAAIGAMFFCSTAALAAEAQVQLMRKVDYQCTDKSVVEASYYKLSDDSLSFVRLSTGEKVFTLPLIAAPSGQNYSDLENVTWFVTNATAKLGTDLNADNLKERDCTESK